MAAAVLRFKQTNVPRQQGEQCRLKVVQGPDYGTVYVLTASRATIGRGEENGIVISDLKASRKHAEVSQTATGWAIKDLGSANGILHNAKVTRAANLKSGDSLTLGETTLEFLAADSGTMMLVAPPRSINEIQQQHANLAAQKKKVQSMGGLFGGGTGPQPAAAAPGQKKGLLGNPKVTMAVGIGVAALLLFGGEDPPKRPPKKDPKKEQEAKDAERNLANYLPGNGDGANARMINQFFQAGFREYREKNYLRAKQQFETVLQMNPGHVLSTIYLENCNKMIEDEVKSHLERGKKSFEAGKLKDSRAHFEAVLRLLYKEQTNPAFKEATDQLQSVQKAINGDPNGGNG